MLATRPRTALEFTTILEPTYNTMIGAPSFYFHKIQQMSFPTFIVTDELLPGVAHRTGNALKDRWHDLLAMNPTGGVEWSPFQIAIHDIQRRISQRAGGIILNGINYEIRQFSLFH